MPSMGGSRMRVFVSYSRAQFYFAEDLALALGQRGIDAWFDVPRLEPGDDWEAGIDRGLREADAVVCVPPRAALASDNVAAELGRARALGKPVFAALAERVGPVEAVAAFDLRRGLEPKLGELVKALEGEPFAPVGGGVPGVVIAVLAALALLALAGVAVAYEIVWSGRVDAAALFYVAAATLFCVWLAVEFARGRRSWLVLIVLSAPGALFALALPLALAAAEPVGV